jgi:tetratricopeptide (TPR) repeat protein
VESLNETERQADGKQDDWSAKDEIAHAIAWMERFVERINTPPADVPSRTFDELNEENAAIFAAHRDQTIEEVLAYAGQIRSALLGAVQALSEEELNDSALLPWLDGAPPWRGAVGNAFTHPLIHYAGYLARHGQPTLAIRMQEEGFERLLELDPSPAWRGTNLYNLACQHALNGDKQKALTLLTEALALLPQLRDWSKQDTDLVSLREEPTFLALVE